jgi:hypothetical protein
MATKEQARLASAAAYKRILNPTDTHNNTRPSPEKLKLFNSTLLLRESVSYSRYLSR